MTLRGGASGSPSRSSSSLPAARPRCRFGWLTGYSQQELEALLEKRTDIETFIAEAPEPNPSRTLINGLICGIRVEDIEEKPMREIRYLDKLIDELAKGKAMEKILRKS